MAKRKDPTIKLAKQANNDSSKMIPLLEASTDELSPEAKEKLENKPKFNDGFLKQEAKRFGTTKNKVEKIAEAVSADSTVFVEQRTWEVDADIKEHFRQLYEQEVARRHTCTEMIEVEEERQRKKEDGTLIGKAEKISVWRRCGAVYESFQQALVHQSLHLMFDSKDPRTKRAMWNDVLDLIHPRKEKGVKAALTAAERRRMMDDRLKERLLRE